MAKDTRETGRMQLAIKRLQELIGVEGVGGIVQTWTPTLTIVANLDAATAFACYYIRLGDVVIFWGRFAAEATAAAGTATSLLASLPVASNFDNAADARGNMTAATVLSSGSLSPDVTANELSFNWLSQTATNTAFSFSGGYIVK